jgi:hypothetical protein
VIQQYSFPPGDEEPEPTAAQVADETAAAIADLFGAADPGGPAAAEAQGADPTPPDDTSDEPGDTPPADHPR